MKRLALAAALSAIGLAPAHAAPAPFPWRIQRLAVTDKPRELKQVEALLESVYRERDSIDDVRLYATKRGAKCDRGTYVAPDDPGRRVMICKKHGGFLLIMEMRMIIRHGGPSVDVFAATEADVP